MITHSSQQTQIPTSPNTLCSATAFPRPHLLRGTEALIGAKLLTQPLPCSLELPLVLGELENEAEPTSASTLHQPGAASTSDGAASPAHFVSGSQRGLGAFSCLCFIDSLKPSAEVLDYTLLIPPMIHSLQIKEGFSHCQAQTGTVKLLREEMSGGNKQAAH